MALEIGSFTISKANVINRRNQLRQKEFDRRRFVFEMKRDGTIPNLSAEEEQRSIEWEMMQGV